MAKHGIAVIGIGKIAVDQHLPVIAKSDAFELAATVSTRGVGVEGVPVFRKPAELYAAMPEVKLVAVCTPPGVRHAIVREALDADKDVLMEKPPTPTISELDDLVAYAAEKGRLLFQTWHSQYNAAVHEARKILADEGVAKLRIDWRESVRKWHPGQEVWTIAAETRKGRMLTLEKGGTVLRSNGDVTVSAPSEEYERIYERFAELLDTGQSEVDDTPLRWVADAFLLGRRETMAPFEW